MEEFNLTAYGTNVSSLRDYLSLLHKKDGDLNTVIKYFFYVISIAVAILGNLCIIFVICYTRTLRTKFNYYIVNLAMADILVPVFCMWVHLVNSVNEEWVLGPFFCKIHTFIQVTVVCSSIFTLTTVTVDRFLAAMFPAYLCVTQKFQALVIIGIWVSSSSISLPWILYQFYSDFYWILGHEVLCESRFPTTATRKNYFLTFFALVYMIPVIVMFILIILTIIANDRSRRTTDVTSEVQEEMRKRAVYMLLTVLVVFCVCWTPQQSCLLWDVYRDRHVKPEGVKQLKFVALYLAYTSSAINPVVYVSYNKCFRYATIELVKNRCRGGNSLDSVAPDPVPSTCRSDVEAGMCEIQDSSSNTTLGHSDSQRDSESK